MRKVRLLSGRSMPVLGQGTWSMGEDRSELRIEIAALRLGIDLGMTLIDTAEMYGDGQAEKLVGEATSATGEKKYFL
jgi:diketogulonate reductase-like aldo/keto reductase